jgi:hypothetical protein
MKKCLIQKILMTPAGTNPIERLMAIIEEFL